jgi:hypothetical protein
MIPYPRIVDRIVILLLGILFCAGLLWIGAYKIKEAKSLASSPVKAHCSLLRSENDGETQVRIQLQTGKDALGSVYVDLSSKPMYQGTPLSYNKLRSESTTVRNEMINYPRAVDDVSCWVPLAVYEDGRKWYAPSRGPFLP